MARPDGPKCLLLVEDNASDARATMRAINRIRPDLEVVWANRVDAAREVVSDALFNGRRPADCIVLDLNLPGTSGMEFLKEIRGTPEVASIPVLILSTSQRQLDRQEAAGLGASGFVTKSFGVKGLEETGTAIARFWERYVEGAAGASPINIAVVDAPPLADSQTVLIIEDDDAFARSLERQLEVILPEYRRVRASTLAEGIAALSLESPAVVIADLNLPDSDSSQTVVRLTQTAPMTPVIVLTGSTFESAGTEAVDSGAQDFLTKGTFDLEELARVLRIAMRRNAVHYRHVHAAFHDSLTGLANRAHFESALAAKCARAAFDDQFAVAFIDIDHFKDANDRYGHSVGDGVLVAVAQRLKTALRSNDLPARWGGDEFAVLLDSVATSFDAQAVTARISESINGPAELMLDLTGEPFYFELSTSIGVALSGSGEGVDPSALIARADKAMYEAKARGGGQVSLTLVI